MACLSSLPSARGRRLFELLEEQQEPFTLDIYLKENGHSDKLLSPRSMCWPGSGCKRLQATASHGFRRRSGGLFKCMLSKFLRGNSIRKALRWDDKATDSRSLGKSRSSTDMNVSKIKAAEEEEEDLQFSSSTGSISGASDEEALWKCLEEEESKQHSPVSVLGLHSCEGSPVHLSHSINGEEDISTFSLELQRKALDIFEELLQVAYTPAFDQITKAEVLQPDRSQKLRRKEVEERVVDSHECSKHNRSLINYEVIQCDDDLSAISKLAVSELSKSWKNWIPFQPQVTETGVQVDDAIFECMLEETVLEMLTGFPCTFDES